MVESPGDACLFILTLVGFMTEHSFYYIADMCLVSDNYMSTQKNGNYSTPISLFDRSCQIYSILLRYKPLKQGGESMFGILVFIGMLANVLGTICGGSDSWSR